jgi:hypothetical protein
MTALLVLVGAALLQVDADPPNSSAAQVQTTHQRPASHASVTAASTQMTNVPYFSQVAGMRSVLAMNNNTPREMTVNVTVFSAQGKPLKVAPITLQPGPTEFKLEDLTGSAAGFGSGNIEVMYQGNSMAVTCQVGVFWPAKRISFESRDPEYKEQDVDVEADVCLPQAASEGAGAATLLSVAGRYGL